MLFFSDSPCEVEDTDPLVTEPVVHRIVSVPATSLPVIPCLGDQIMIATASIRARGSMSTVRPTVRNANTIEPGGVAFYILGMLTETPDGLDGAQIWRALHTFPALDGMLSRGKLNVALLKLERMNLIRNRPGVSNRRLYTAVQA